MDCSALHTNMTADTVQGMWDAESAKIHACAGGSRTSDCEGCTPAGGGVRGHVGVRRQSTVIASKIEAY